MAFQANSADPITHFGFRYGARTGTPPVHVVTLESLVATTGLPDGTDIGGGSATAKTFTPPADATWDGTWQWIALTNAYTPTVGQILCGTIRYSSGTIDASNNSSFTSRLASLGGDGRLVWFSSITNTGGTWSRTSFPPTMAYRTASGRYGWPAESIYNTRSASTVGHRVACKFTLPSNVTNTYTIRGVKFSGSVASAIGKVPVIGLWSAGSTLQTLTMDSDLPQSISTSYNAYDHVLFDESSLTALSPGTAYYIGLEVADAVNGGVLINGINLDDGADQSAFPLGTNVCLSTYNGSSWTDDTTVRPFVELILDDMTQQAGGGGGGYVIGS